MTIEIAADNHIGEACQKVTKKDQKDIAKGGLMWQTLAEWFDSVESSFYQDHDCDGVWACVTGLKNFNW